MTAAKESRAGSGSARQTQYRPRRRQRKSKRFPWKSVLAVLALIALIIVLVIGIKKLLGAFRDPSAENATASESILDREVRVNGVDITGMSEAEALLALEKKYPWSMQVTVTGAEEITDATYDVDNLLRPAMQEVLSRVYGTLNPEKSYTFSEEVDPAAVDAQIEAMKARWNRAPKNGSISGFDTETGDFVYAGEEYGIEIDEISLREDMLQAVSGRRYDAKLQVSVNHIVPEISAEMARSLYKTIGYYQTKSTANPDRNNNLNLACHAINGLVFQPGEEFSFNNATGNRTVEAGYKAAAAYQNGLVVQEPGGGVCQVASTLYNAIVLSGLEVTERHAHTFEPSYVTPGEDATVSYDGYQGPDLRFTNTTQAALAILAEYKDQTVTCSLVGIPILAEGETISMRSEKTGETEVPPPIYEADETMELGVVELVSEGTKGSTWKTYLVHKHSDGSEEVEFFHTSIYKGHNPTCKRNPLTTEEYTTTLAEGEEPDPLPGETMIGPNGEILLVTEETPEPTRYTVPPAKIATGSTSPSATAPTQSTAGNVTSPARVPSSTAATRASAEYPGGGQKQTTSPGPSGTTAAGSPGGPGSSGSGNMVPGGLDIIETVPPHPGF